MAMIQTKQLTENILDILSDMIPEPNSRDSNFVDQGYLTESVF